MASNSEGKSAPSNDGTPKASTPASSKLESLPRDDLIKFVKKQMLQMQKMKGKCDELNKEVESLKSAKEIAASTTGNNTELQSLREQLECLEMKNSSMTTSFQSLQEDYNIISSQNKVLQDEVGVLTEARDSAVSALKSLQSASQKDSTQQVAVLQEEKDKLAAYVKDLEEIQKERDGLSEENENLKEKMSKAVAMIEKLKKDRVQTKTAMEDLQKANDSLTKDLEAAKDSLEQMKSPCEGLAQVQSARSSLTEELNLAKENITRLQSSNEGLTLELKAAGEKVAQLKLNEEAMSKEKARLSTENEELHLKNTSLTDLVQETTKNLDLLSSESQQNQGTISDLKLQLEESEKSVASLEAEKTSRLAQETVNNEETERSQTAVAELERELEKYRDEVKKYSEATELLMEKLNASESSCAELSGSIEQHKAEVTKLTEEMKKTEDDREKAEEKLREWEEMMSMLEEERNQLQHDMVDADTKAREEISELNTSLHDAMAECDNVRSQLCSVGNEKENLEGQLRDMFSIVEEVKRERNESLDKCSQLESHVTSLEEKLDNMVKDTELLNSENEVQMREMQALKEKESFLLDQADRHKLDMEQMLQKVKDNDTESSAAESVTSQLRVEIEQLKRDLQISKSDEEKLRKSFEESQHQIDSFKPEQELLQSKLAEMKTVRRQLDAAKEENEKHLSSIAKLEEEADDCGKLNVIIENLSEQNQSLGRQSEEIRVRNLALEENSERLNRQLIDQEESMKITLDVNSKLETERAQLREENVKLVESRKQLTAETQELSLRYEKVENELKLLRENSDKTDEADQIAHLQSSLSETETSLLQVQSQLDARELEFKETSEANSALTMKMKEELDKAKETTHTLEKDKNLAEERLSERELEAQKWKKVHEELEITVEKEQDEILKLKTELESLRENYDELKERMCKDEADNKESSLLLEQTQQELNMHAEERDKLKEQLVDLSASAEKLGEEKSMLEEKIQSYCEDIEKKTCENIEIVKERDSLSQQIASLKVTSDEANNKCCSLEKEKRDIIQQLDEVKEKCKRSEELHEAAESTVHKLKAEVSQLQNEKEGLANQVHSLTDRLHSLTSSESDTAGRISELHKDLDDKSSLVKDLSEKNDHVKKELEEVSENYQLLLRDLSARDETEQTMKEKCESLEKERQSLKANVEEVSIKLVGKQEELDKSIECLNLEKQTLIDTAEKEKQDLIQKLKITEEKVQKNADDEAMIKEQTKIQSVLVDELKNKLKETEDGFVDLQEILKVKDNEINDLHAKCKMQGEEFVDLQEKLKVKEVEIHDVNAKLNSKVTEISDLQTKLTESNSTDAEAYQKSQDKLGELERETKERETRENKLKQIILKSKKETGEYKTKLASVTAECEELRREITVMQKQLSDRNESQNQHVINYQNLHSEYDKLEGRYETEKAQCKRLESDLKKVIDDLTEQKLSTTSLTEDMERVEERLQQADRDKQELHATTMTLQHQLETAETDNNKLHNDKTRLEKDIDDMRNEQSLLREEHDKELKKIQEQLDNTAQQLDAVKRDAQQSSMMDLEIADYERTVKCLNEQVAEQSKTHSEQVTEIQRLEAKITALQKQNETSESQYIQAEERGNKLKQLLVKCKKDLADAKKSEGEQKSSESQLRAQLELLTQDAEQYKIQVAGLVSENQRLSDKVRTMTETHQRSMRSMELKHQSVEQDLELVRSDLTAVQTDFDSYKVRVCSARKAQTRRPQDDLGLEQEKQERQRVEKMLDHCKSKLLEANEQNALLKNENDLLQDEHDRLQQRHAKMMAEMSETESSLRRRVEELRIEQSTSSSEHVDTIKQLTITNEMLSNTFKEQMKVLQEEHQRSVDMLQKHVDSAEVEILSLRSQLQAAAAVNVSMTTSSNEHGEHVVEKIRDPRSVERHPAEGMEYTDNDCPRTPLTLNTSLVPFEQLINSPTSEDTASLKTIEDADNQSELKTRLSSANKRIEHLTELLNESEATSMRLTEQAKVLKEEIRYMERNTARDKSISNMEYLKNVVFKFLTLGNTDEKLQLVPVLCTMLKLSPEEKECITTIANGGDSAKKPSDSVWGAYLHRWSALS